MKFRVDDSLMDESMAFLMHNKRLCRRGVFNWSAVKRTFFSLNSHCVQASGLIGSNLHEVIRRQRVYIRARNYTGDIDINCIILLKMSEYRCRKTHELDTYT